VILWTDCYKLYSELAIKGIRKQIKPGVDFGGAVKDPWGSHKAVFNINGNKAQRLGIELKHGFRHR